MMTPAQFEDMARKAMEAKLGIRLGKGAVDIHGRKKSFDLLNEEERVVGEVKLLKI